MDGWVFCCIPCFFFASLGMENQPYILNLVLCFSILDFHCHSCPLLNCMPLSILLSFKVLCNISFFVLLVDIVHKLTILVRAPEDPP